MSLSKIDVTTVERPAPKSGPTSSADYNSTLSEMINTFIQFSTEWNTVLQPLIDTLPTGFTGIIREDRTETPNPFLNGFDGSQIYMDLTSTEITENGKFFTIDEDRPLTIKESFLILEDNIADQIQEVLAELARVSQESGISTRQKQAIGARIFDPDQSSSSTSLDGLVQQLLRNQSQLSFDISGDDDFFQNQGVQTLDFSLIEQLQAIQAAHTYDSIFNTVSHDNLDIHSHKFHQVVVGAINGINKEYFLPGTDVFVGQSLQVIVNGLEEQRIVNYSERPDKRGFIFTAGRSALIAGVDDVWVHYIVG